MLEVTSEMKNSNNFGINAVNSHGIEDVDQILIECQLSYFNVVSLFTDDSMIRPKNALSQIQKFPRTLSAIFQCA